MSYTVEGKLVKKYDTESKTATFSAREFVLEVPDGNYPQFVKLQLVQDRCSLIDAFNEGDMMKVDFDLRGREWQGKYFTSLNAWKVGKADGAAPSTGATSAAPPQSATVQTAATPMPTIDNEPTASADDLPF